MAKREKEIFGQYASDRINGRVSKDTTGTLGVRGDGNMGFHSKDGSLFDEGYEDAVGTYRIGEDVRLVSADEVVERHIGKKALRKTRDEADAWLQAHDPDYDRRDYA